MLGYIFSKFAVQKRVALMHRECSEKVEQLWLRTPMKGDLKCATLVYVNMLRKCRIINTKKNREKEERCNNYITNSPFL